jgi:hypothetical protein
MTKTAGVAQALADACVEVDESMVANSVGPQDLKGQPSGLRAKLR